jgi:hypothetical protein
MGKMNLREGGGGGGFQRDNYFRASKGHAWSRFPAQKLESLVRRGLFSDPLKKIPFG